MPMLIYLPMIIWAGLLQVTEDERKARARLRLAKCPTRDNRQLSSRR